MTTLYVKLRIYAQSWWFGDGITGFQTNTYEASKDDIVSSTMPLTGAGAPTWLEVPSAEAQPTTEEVVFAVDYTGPVETVRVTTFFGSSGSYINSVYEVFYSLDGTTYFDKAGEGLFNEDVTAPFGMTAQPFWTDFTETLELGK